MARSKSSSARSGKAPVWVMALFFGVFTLFGILGTWFFLVRPMTLLWQSQSWDAKDCEVLSSQVQSHSSDDGTTYSVDIEYRYEVGGQTYTSDRFHFMGGSSSGYAGKAAVVEKHPPGAVVTCWVDPEDPNEAVLDRSFRWIYLVGLFPLLFLAVGLGGVFFWIASKRLPKTDSAFGPEGGFREMEFEASRKTPDIGPKVLEPPVSPLGKLIGMLFITLFWNGIVSVFVYQEYQAWRHGGGFAFGCGTLFLIPFVLIGLGLVCGVFYYLLALANPRPRLLLDPGSPRLGGSATLAWEIEGAVGRIRHLKLSLVGNEEARYRRGTDTHTDRHKFYEQVLYETEQSMQMRKGSISVSLPTDQMHSFEAPNNKVAWTLAIRGDIARWPDVIENFPLEIQPAAVE